MESVKKTAVKWLEAMVESKLSQPMSANFKELFEQAKEMEKKQIMNAHEEGFYSPPFKTSRDIESENYYEQTYGGNK